MIDLNSFLQKLPISDSIVGGFSLKNYYFKIWMKWQNGQNHEYSSFK